MSVKSVTLPKADMRWVKLEGLTYKRNSGYVCERCGLLENSKCTKKRVVKECSDFMPILAFRPPIKGMEDEFNTFRLGTAWTRRLIEGNTIALQNSKTKEIFGFATVTWFKSGSKYEMSKAFGNKNHNLSSQNVSKKDIGNVMQERLKRAYGKMIFDNNNEATVIQLKRCN